MPQYQRHSTSHQPAVTFAPHASQRYSTNSKPTRVGVRPTPVGLADRWPTVNLLGGKDEIHFSTVTKGKLKRIGRIDRSLRVDMKDHPLIHKILYPLLLVTGPHYSTPAVCCDRWRRPTKSFGSTDALVTINDHVRMSQCALPSPWSPSVTLVQHSFASPDSIHHCRPLPAQLFAIPLSSLTYHSSLNYRSIDRSTIDHRMKNNKSILASSRLTETLEWRDGDD